jgi:hypothetical protein
VPCWVGRGFAELLRLLRPEFSKSTCKCDDYGKQFEFPKNYGITLSKIFKKKKKEVQGI